MKHDTITISVLFESYPSEALRIFQDASILNKEAALMSWYDDMKKKSVLAIHKNRIWQSPSDGKWRTYIDGENGTRKLIALKEEVDLYQVLAEHYQIIDSKNKITLATLFPKWMQYKALHSENSSKTLKHHEYDWKKYYEGSDIIIIPICKLTKITLDEWIHRLIKSEKLTTKQYANIATIINQMLDYAADQGIVESNLYKKVHVSRRVLITPPKKSASTQIFYPDELQDLIDEAYKDFDETGDTSSLAIIICARTGIRVGECLALETNDYCDNILHIWKEEVIRTPLLPDGSFGKREYEVVEHCKSEAGIRDVPIISEVSNVLKMIRKENLKRNISSNYLFVQRNGQKMHASSIDKKIRTLCDRAGIAPRSAHKLRKTFISMLLDGGMNPDTVRTLAGHANISVTLQNYCYDTSKPNQIKEKLEKVLEHY